MPPGSLADPDPKNPEFHQIWTLDGLENPKNYPNRFSFNKNSKQ